MTPIRRYVLRAREQLVTADALRAWCATTPDEAFALELAGAFRRAESWAYAYLDKAERAAAKAPR